MTIILAYSLPEICKGWFCFVCLFLTVPNAANPDAPESPEDNAIPESTPSPPDQGRIGPEIPGNPGKQLGD